MNGISTISEKRPNISLTEIKAHYEIKCTKRSSLPLLIPALFSSPLLLVPRQWKWWWHSNMRMLDFKNKHPICHLERCTRTLLHRTNIYFSRQ